jgi:hypothetical protein
VPEFAKRITQDKAEYPAYGDPCCDWVESLSHYEIANIPQPEWLQSQALNPNPRVKMMPLLKLRKNPPGGKQLWACSFGAIQMESCRNGAGAATPKWKIALPAEKFELAKA